MNTNGVKGKNLDKQDHNFISALLLSKGSPNSNCVAMRYFFSDSFNIWNMSDAIGGFQALPSLSSKPADIL